MSATYLPNKPSSIWIPCSIGVLAFLIIAGHRFLDPTNVAWLVGGDPLQHYLGWAFYRNSPWTWPIGLNPLYGMEFSNSIVFTDSIPLLAIPFKTIHQFLPNPFQYLGIWVLFCFVLQAYFAFRLIGLITHSIAIQCLGSVLFLFSPPLIFRLSLHESLMGHFIILAALYLNLKPLNDGVDTKKKYLHSLAWIFLLCIAVLTHFYLALMASFLWISDLMRRILLQKSASLSGVLIEAIIAFGAVIFVAWQAGYFAIQSASSTSRGFGDFRTNLLAIFNSRGWSYFIKPIPLRDSVEAATGEGFQYLGAGSILLLCSSLYALLSQKIKLSELIRLLTKYYSFLSIALIVLALISFSNNVGFGPWNLRIPLPEFVINLLSVVRASSRLFWPMYYAIILGILWMIIKAYTSRKAIVLLTFAALIQIVDTSVGWLNIRDKINLSPTSEFKTKLISPFWDDAGHFYRNVVTNDSPGVWEDFGLFASKHKLATNITYMARIDSAKEISFLQSIGSQLYDGPLNSESLYILRDWKNASDKANYNYLKYNPNTDLLANVDGFNVLAPRWKKCESCRPIEKGFELHQLAPIPEIEQEIDFSKKGNGRAKYMLNGWGYTEDWGTWAVQPVSSIVVPMPKGDPTKLIIVANAFLSPQHREQVVDIAINGMRVADHMILKKEKANIIEIKLPRGLKAYGEPVMVEFRSLNASSPKEAGLGLDDRKLGIGLVSMYFSR